MWPEWLHHEASGILWFAVSFVLIATFWLAHERLFRYVERQTPLLSGINVLWTMSIVGFPIVIALLNLPGEEQLQKGLYMAAMVVCAVTQAVMMVLVVRSASIRGSHPVPEPRMVADSISNAVLFSLALVVGMLIPGWYGFFALFLVGLMPWAVRIITPRVERAFPVRAHVD